MTGHLATPATELAMATRTTPTTHVLTIPSPAPVRFIDAEPVQTLLASIKGEIATITRLSPNNDARTALEDVCLRLERAITDGGSRERWITAEEAAKREGVTPSAITSRIRKGKVPHQRIGGRYLVDACALGKAA